MHPFFRHLSALGVLCAALLSACTPAPQLGCPDDLEFFRTRLWEPTMSVQCIACHNSEGLAAGTRLVLQPPEAPGALEANFWAVRGLARVQHEGTSLLLLKPSGLHPDGHGGGGLLPQDSSRYDDFRHFVDRVTGVPGACEASPQQACAPESNEPGARQRLRLLTRFEYDSTLRELLRLDGTWAGSFPAEAVVHGFDNNADARVVDQLLSDELLATAERAAEAALANLGSHVSCAPGETCAKEFITRFGERAFRRPLTETEHARYLGLYNTVALEDGYTAGIQAVIASLLLSPHFLYRAELGEPAGDGRHVLTDYEVASELSYLFWGSMPDDELFAQARAGALRTPEQLSTQARRLLASPRSRPLLDHFVSQWLELERLDQAQKDPTAFADFTPSLRAAMPAETTTFFDPVIRQGSGRLPEL
ncbi:MAG TPA: DUF1592 domain-containing protein, partial [Myxococcaceae bacterium]|nr:DUF1592 domain-containing protein [Myxococcaceae bacterium]